MFFGDDDIVVDRPYQASMKCVSFTGNIYVVKRDEFLELFKTRNETWRHQFNLNKAKETRENKAVQNYAKVQV